MTEHGRRAPRTDFTTIDGVGRKTANALDGAGVESMGTLAAMTVDEVVDLLKEAGVPSSAGKIISARWLQQAWRFSRTDEAGESSDIEAAAESVVEPGHALENNRSDWEEYAGFFIYFDRAQHDGTERWRTRVWDTKAMVEEDFPGTAAAPWIRFVLGRANLPASAYTPGPAPFEIERASMERRTSPEGAQTWLRAEVVVDLQQQGALEAAFDAALRSAIEPHVEQENEEP